MAIYDHPVTALDGSPADLGDYRGKAMLIVNVASKCGLTPQYEGLQKLYERYRERGFSVLGFPCNQFMGQEPGTPEEIQEFCSTNYNVTFPMFAKIEVNGAGRDSLYKELTQVSDSEGVDGDIRWNFEKFLVNPSGEIVGRFAPQVEPDDAVLVAAVEAALTT